jgi:hypothetical protein
MDEDLEILIKKTWDQWNKYGDPLSPYYIKEVRPLPPILFVGNLAEYRRSKIKVITVSLNPSKNGEDPATHAREFPAWVGVDSLTLKNQRERYLKGLNNYFEKPYEKYFSKFEMVLNGMDISYYSSGKMDKQTYRNRALHTDLCSPLTTNPNWGYIDRNIQKSLGDAGSSLWNELVSNLKPDVILASFGKSYLKWIKLQLCDETKSVKDLHTWEKIYEIPGEKPYIVNGLLHKIDLKQPPTSLIAYGRNSTFGQPFNTTASNKKEIGRQLLIYMKNNGLAEVGCQ